MDSSSPLDWLVDSAGKEARLNMSNSGGQRFVPLKQRNVKKSSVFGHSPEARGVVDPGVVSLLFLVVGPEAVDDPEDCCPPEIPELPPPFDFLRGLLLLEPPPGKTPCP